MAIITISATGGNFNDTAAWVGGVVPTSADDIVGDASSGQLTVNVNSSVRTVNFSTYTNTITFNADLTLVHNGTSVLGGASTNYAGTVGRLIFSQNHSISQNNTNRIPNMSINGGRTITPTTDIYLTNYTTVTGNAVFGSSVFSFFVNGNLQLLVTGSRIVMDGTGSVTGGQLNTTSNGLVEFNTLGTITITTSFNTYSNARIKYVSGTIINPILSHLMDTAANISLTLETSGMTWDRFYVNYWNDTNTNANYVLNEQLNVNDLIIASSRGVNGFNPTYSFTGTQKLNVNNRFIWQTAGNGSQQNTKRLRFNTSATHYIDKLFILSSPFDQGIVRSTTNGVQANIQLGEKINSPIFFTNFIDINASAGEQIRVYDGVVTNSNNVVNYTTDIFATTGGGEFSSVFVN